MVGSRIVAARRILFRAMSAYRSSMKRSDQSGVPLRSGATVRAGGIRAISGTCRGLRGSPLQVASGCRTLVVTYRPLLLSNDAGKLRRLCAGQHCSYGKGHEIRLEIHSELAIYKTRGLNP